MKTDLWDYFSNGSVYETEGPTIDEPRDKCCKSCALGLNPETVRPKDVPLVELQHHVADFDVFYCHEQLTDGSFKVCAKWFALFGDNLANHAKRNQEINDILTKDMV